MLGYITLPTNNLSNTLNIVLFISTGLLTLITMVSFFFNISMQNNISKMNDLLSRILDCSDTQLGPSIGHKLTNLVTKYQLIYQISVDRKDKIYRIVSRSFIAPILLWISIAFITHSRYKQSEWFYVLGVIIFASIVLWSFRSKLLNLIDFENNGLLPRKDELFNFDTTIIEDYHIILSKTCVIFVEFIDDELVVKIGFPLEVNKLDARLKFYSFEEQNLDLLVSDDVENNAKFNIEIVSGYPDGVCYDYIFYPFENSIVIDKHKEVVHILLELESTNYRLDLTFTSTLKELLGPDKIFLYPSNLEILQTSEQIVKKL